MKSLQSSSSVSAIEFQMLIILVHLLDADGTHGLLLRRVGSDPVLHDQILPFHGCSFRSLCSPMHPAQEPSLDRNAQAPHWILWATAAVCMLYIYLPICVVELNKYSPNSLVSWTLIRFAVWCRDCAQILVNSHSAAPDSKLKAVYKKYSSLERGAVALNPPAVKMLEELKVSLALIWLLKQSDV